MTTIFRTILTTGFLLLFSISQRSTAFSTYDAIHIKGINDTKAFTKSEENPKRKLIFSHLLPPEVKTIVLDAGHGGKDRGCKGSIAKEKEIALSITKKVGEYISAYHPDVKVIFTRTEDVFVTLNERARIANRNKADLFISIHCNYIRKRPEVRGSETYVMGLHTADHNLNVAMRENASIALEQNFEEGYDGYDPNSAESHIMLSMYQNAFLERSILFAELVENQIPMNGEGKHKSRGVRQAGFLVLKATAMPSVLVESGYLSNDIDEKLLLSDNGQKNVAFSIFKAFTSYKNIIEGDQPGELVQTGFVQTEPSAQETKKSENENTASEEPALIEEERDLKLENSVIADVAVNDDNLSVATNEKPTDTAVSKPNIEKSKTYRIQLVATPLEIDMNIPKWAQLKDDIKILKVDGLLKYLIETGSEMEAAQRKLEEIRSNGFPKAFLSSYRGDKRIKILHY
ncbi:MAG: N-acetylmuramoyl-L-alanine amidase [Bacteroidia bacterium]|nr:N-acetylmuramoyl-L-alanine amidase [Bacteroidia bacterium]